MQVSGWRRWPVGVWAGVEVLLLGGLVYGWPSLVFLLKQRQVYSDLCRPDVTPQLRHNHTLPPQSGVGNASDVLPADASLENGSSRHFFRREAGGVLMSFLPLPPPPCLESQGCQFDPTFFSFFFPLLFFCLVHSLFLTYPFLLFGPFSRSVVP